MNHKYEKRTQGIFITVGHLDFGDQIAAFTMDEHGMFAYEAFKSALGPIKGAYLFDCDLKQVVVGTLDELMS